MRCKTEKSVATAIVQEALARGLQISVTSLRDDGEWQIVEKQTDPSRILQALDSGGELDRLNLYTAHGFDHGFLYLKYGECHDLVVDYSEGNLDCSQLADLAQNIKRA